MPREMDEPLLGHLIEDDSSTNLEVKDALLAAINDGAPMYNRGDISGCARLYQATAEAVVASSSLVEPAKYSASRAEKQRLSEALRQARGMPAKDAAWALRHAFDDVLEGRCFALQGRDHSVLEKTVVGTDREKARRGAGASVDVRGRIEKAISLGVPLFNSGDHGGCAQEYRDCLCDIQGALDVTASEAVQKVLQELPMLSNDGKRAWALRHTLDSILAGTCESGSPLGGVQSFVVDFGKAAEVDAWQSVNDGVMGGRSTGRMAAAIEGKTGEPCGVFEGILSTQNNGGFSSVRGPVRADGAAYDLSRFQGLAITFIGDERQYKLTIKTDTQFDSPMYQADFTGGSGAGGRWMTKTLDWSAFKPSWRGRVVDSAPRLTGKQTSPPPPFSVNLIPSLSPSFFLSLSLPLSRPPPLSLSLSLSLSVSVSVSLSLFLPAFISSQPPSRFSVNHPLGFREFSVFPSAFMLCQP